MDAVSSGPAPVFFIRSRDAHTAGYDLTNEVPIVPVRQRVGSLHYWELSRCRIGGTAETFPDTLQNLTCTLQGLLAVLCLI